MRIAINGMGRIGRLLLRRLLNLKDIDLVAINDIMVEENLAYLLRYDSIYGPLAESVSVGKGELSIGNRSFAVYRREDPATLPWADLGVDVVLECSGRFTSREAAAVHLTAGARRVMLSTTGSLDIPLLIYGYNQQSLAAGTTLISPGGCMTNCCTPLLSILDRVGIESVQVNILHSYTSRQELVDAPHRQFRRGRAAAESIIPVEIDLAASLERLLPAFRGRIAAVSTRVPVANGAMADFTVQLRSEAGVREINHLFRKAAQEEYRGIVDYNEDALVSLDVKGNTHSCVVDGTLTSAAGQLVKIIAWFDNEYGYTSRMIDWLYYWKN
ncbi:MAG TPA: glyceraldehyde 3-phosphate dehydrogenase NAD-binding domain-containing protein [Puia sp.]|nr:glyceraldehyde 3-phosphate dehydrogenase NAD-binding domain-containing protein [Puia sp.]